VRTSAGVKRSDGGVTSRWFVRRRSARREEPEEEDEVWGKKDKLPPLPYLYPRSRGHGRGSSAPLPRQFLGTAATCRHGAAVLNNRATGPIMAVKTGNDHTVNRHLM
jgi:hypothetical protein